MVLELTIIYLIMIIGFFIFVLSIYCCVSEVLVTTLAPIEITVTEPSIEETRFVTETTDT